MHCRNSHPRHLAKADFGPLGENPRPVEEALFWSEAGEFGYCPGDALVTGVEDREADLEHIAVQGAASRSQE